MNYAYIRFSTDKQDEQEQMNIINKFIANKGLKIDKIVKDEGVSGGVSYKERKLSLLLDMMKSGDTLIVSEVSRLSRSMGDLNRLVNDELKARKLRLIIVSMGIDLNCDRMTAIDELLLNNFAFAAQLEKELIQERTRNALEARKKAGKEVGGTNNLWGKNTGADREEAIYKASLASAKARREKAMNKPENKTFWEFIEDWEMAFGKIDKNTDFTPIANKLNERGKTTPTGLPFNRNRAKAMYDKLERMYNQN